MRAYRHLPHIPPFCRQAWRIPAMVLIVLFIGTFAWGIHLVRDHADQLGLGMLTITQSANPELNAQSVAMTQPVSQTINPIRVAMVNIAGISKAANGQEGTYVSTGSGVIINPKGYVVTAQHLIQDLAEILVRVQTPFGPRQYPAKTVKVLPQHDLALIKIVSQDIFPYLALEQTPVLKVGDPVQAWGDPVGTEAIQRVGTLAKMDLTEPVLIKGNQLTHLMLTDAVYNWAQNGGPLVNGSGHLVGINLAVEDGNGRIFGYAIPTTVLVTHFQEVVTFVHKSSPASTLNPSAEPLFAAPESLSPSPQQPPQSRAPRTADIWWQKMQGLLGVNLGKHVALTTPGDPVGAIRDPVHETRLLILGYTPGNFLGLLLLGFISGISGGMMTMGGGIIKVTGLMWFFGYGLLLVRPVAYITNIFMYGAAMLRYQRQGLLKFHQCRPLIPWAMAGMVLGYFIGNVMSKTAIQWLLGAFALLLGIKMLVEITEYRVSGYRKSGDMLDEDLPPGGQESAWLTWLQKYFGSRVDDDLPPPEWQSAKARHGMLGLPMGIISGILGITGGVIEVPLQRYIARMPLRTAIANSATLVFFASIVGSMVALWHGVNTGSFEVHTPVVMALILTPGAFVGGMVGAWLTSVIPLNVLRWFYAVLMFIIAIRMFLS
ncbi:MAG: TSUP family transporter [Magnetococcales bacterium]|nr:TSUP family transporter [Magnetococcales bacterium]NGZ07088.1 TSUP family transporter [Magnetococcales bacterium]